jgi:cytochrome c-type biogenesis protein CcmE
MHRKTKFLLGSFLIVASVATLIYSAVQETSAYFLTMEEYAAAAGDHDGKSLRLAGRVAGDSVDWNPMSLNLAFQMEPIPPREGLHEDRPVVALGPDTVRVLEVRYNGIVPDMFAEGRDVIVEGTVANGIMEADTLLTTCPSKYEAELQPDEVQTDGVAPSNTTL